MGRPRTGNITFDKERGLFVARITYHNEQGKRRDVRRTAATKTDALRLLSKLKRELEDGGAQSIDADKLTFRHLAAEYESVRLVAPTYEAGQKVGGLRSWQDQRRRLKHLAAYFGKRLVKSITFGDLETFKRQRLAQESKRGGQLSIASANRELALLRSVFAFAVQSRWLARSPFDDGRGLISLSLESKRERILSRDEEARILAACDCAERKHIRPVLIVALDTAARHGELLRLTWNDIDIDAGLISLSSYKGKLHTVRTVGMTARVRSELRRLWAASPQRKTDSVFGIKAGFRKAFESACRVAGVEGFRFHDCRHTAITRLVQAGMPHTEIMKLSGHTVFATFARYVNTTAETARRGAEALENLYAPKFDDVAVSEFVN